MKQVKYQLYLYSALLLMLLSPQMLLAAPSSIPQAEEAVAAETVAAEGVELKLAYQDGLYTVYARFNFATAAPQFLLGSQVTLRTPHALDADRFTAENIVSLLPDADWQLTSRVDAPAENGSADYLSFTLELLADASQQTRQWQAGQEIKLFSFENGGTCLGATELMSATDPFYQPVAAGGFNSAYTDPVNSFIVAAQGDSYLNEMYTGVYDTGTASCGTRSVEFSDYIFLPVVVNQ